MKDLLLEIGTEEIPAGYIEPALKALSDNLLKKLTDARIDRGDAAIYGTPRRLSVKVSNVADKQRSLTAEILGPPASVGFKDGKPTIAAEKFAEKAGIEVKDIRIKETKKGSYLCADITEEGLFTETILSNLLPEVIQAIPFPKTMKWADLNVSFARPIRSLLAMLGTKVIPFVLGNIESGSETFGHRFMCPGSIRISEPGKYVSALRDADVLVDLDERRKRVEQEVARIAGQLGGTVLADSELTDIVKNLVEYPIAVAGKFDTSFLEVPDEVLINAMRKHQKYFAVVDATGRLMPCFIAVNNTKAKDLALVAKGHERVLRARLSDAKFFYESDLNTPSDHRVEKLNGVLFQAKLGSMYEKTQRIQKLVEYLADQIAPGSDLTAKALRAARLCKADLVSQVVVEFPELQGVMGKIYALKAGENPEVAAAIEEHYRPTFSGGSLPETLTGSVLAIADKVDSICGCFSAGLIPTGASDPYALRRQSIGVLQIMLKNNFSFSLKQLIETGIHLFAEKSDRPNHEIFTDVYMFFQHRMSYLLAEEGFSKDVIAAVIDVSADHVPNVKKRVHALENLKAAPDFEPLAIAFKRVVNIIRKEGYAESAELMINVNETLFEKDCESNLYAAYQNVKESVLENLKIGNFGEALVTIASLRPSVDAFFDGVMVMTDDLNLRKNRLALLKQISDLFGMFADFSKIST